MNALEIKNKISESNEVILTSHIDMDLDALGSILGLYYICTNLGKKTYIVIDDKEHTIEIKRALNNIKKEFNININSYKSIEKIISDKSLLIITDTNNEKRVQNKNLLNIKNKIVIDHHIISENKINSKYEYIDENASSAIEMILYLIDELNIYIPTYIATIMLAGMYIDTNGFLIKTTEKTHKSAALLYKFNVDTIETEQLLKQNFNEYKRRQKLVLKTEFINNYAISYDESVYIPIELAKASDVLLTFNDIEASFVIAKIDKNTIGISARSIGNIDVEKIMKHFNGGGHRTIAATQIEDTDIEKVKNDLIYYLGGLE